MVCAGKIAEAQDRTVKRKILSADFADCTDFYVILTIKKLLFRLVRSTTHRESFFKKDSGQARMAAKRKITGKLQ